MIPDTVTSVTALPTLPDFIEYESVYLPKNHFIREEHLDTISYMSHFFPFEAIDFVKHGIESRWSAEGVEMFALVMTTRNKPKAVF